MNDVIVRPKSQQLRVLVVDDDRLSRETTARLLREAGYPCVAVDNAFAALERLESESIDVVVTDLRMPMMDGLTFLKELKGAATEIEVIVVTGYGSVESAVEAMQEGAADYLAKPFRIEELDARLQKLGRLKAIREERDSLKELLAESSETCGLLIRSAAMRQVWERIELFAENDAPVLVTGETGTGKELVSRALHSLSRRRDASLVAVASGAIPRDLAESELFGHEKGAFTGALRLQKGSFERADKGTLLLDDVDDLPLEIQVKLLRVLQDGTLLRVGGDPELAVDVRVVATTKVDLERAVVEGRFREDLYYRLRGLEIHLPPLRQRRDEILVLAQRFLRELAVSAGEAPQTLSTEAVERLSCHAWPGNVRELKRVIESAVVLCRGEEITAAHLPEFLCRDGVAGRCFSLHLADTGSIVFQDVVYQFESEILDWAMRRAGGRQSKAAKLLDLPRTTLQTKLGR